MTKEKKIGTGIGIMVLKNGKILLGKRHEDPEKASSELKGEGKWTMPGGKLHFGESFEQGAIREVKEETEIKLNDIKVIGINNDQVEDAHFITIGLLAETNQEPQVLEPDEITEWRWFPLDQLPSPLYFPSAKLLENYKNKQFYIKEPTREFVSTVYIIKNGKALFNFHQDLKKFIPVGGHIEPNELPCKAAIREAKEESGFDIELIEIGELKNKDLTQNWDIQLDIIKPNHHHINLSYIGKIISGEQLEKSDRNTELRWFSPEEIKNSTEIPNEAKEKALKAIKIMENR